MSGYTPLFSSLTTGTLCGRWPDIGLWPIVLSMADKNGVVDVTTQYISSVTGLAHDQVVECMHRFCQSDPGSRTNDLDGARLALIDPATRSWGWRVVNHGKYKEKARLMAKSASEVLTGANRNRMGERRGPPVTAEDPLSDADADADADAEEEGQPAKSDPAEEALKEIQAAYPKRKGSHRWADAKSHLRERLRERYTAEQIIAGVKRYAAYVRHEDSESTEYVQQAATFLGKNKGFLEPWTLEPAAGEKPKANGFRQADPPRAARMFPR